MSVSILQFWATFGRCDTSADRNASAYSHSFIFHFTWASEHSIITSAFIQTNRKTSSSKQKRNKCMHNKCYIPTHNTHIYMFLQWAIIIFAKTRQHQSWNIYIQSWTMCGFYSMKPFNIAQDMGYCFRDSILLFIVIVWGQGSTLGGGTVKPDDSCRKNRLHFP